MTKVLALLGALTIGGFADPPQIVLQPESSVWLEGTSTVRDFRCTAAQVEGSVTPRADAPFSLTTLQNAVESVELTIPVGRLGCGNGKMDEHMKKALKEQEHATIEFRAGPYTVAPSGQATSMIELPGTLTIAGVQQPITLRADATLESDGTLRVQGYQTITMSRWGVKPPSLMLGTMKVKDEIVVHYDIRLRQN